MSDGNSSTDRLYSISYTGAEAVVDLASGTWVCDGLRQHPRPRGHHDDIWGDDFEGKISRARLLSRCKGLELGGWSANSPAITTGVEYDIYSLLVSASAKTCLRGSYLVQSFVRDRSR